MRSTILAVLLASLALAGCGGAGSPASTNEASKSPAQVLSDAQAARDATSSVKISGHFIRTPPIGDPQLITIDLSFVKRKGQVGSMGIGTPNQPFLSSYDFVVIGFDLYIRARHFGGGPSSVD